LHGGTRFDYIAAGTSDGRRFVLWMDVLFH
jgi:hypothetical protein